MEQMVRRDNSRKYAVDDLPEWFDEEVMFVL